MHVHTHTHKMLTAKAQEDLEKHLLITQHQGGRYHWGIHSDRYSLDKETKTKQANYCQELF